MGVAADRGVVDDLAAPALEHPGEHAGGQVGDADEVDLEHRVHQLHVLLLEQSAGDQAGVVEQHVDAPEIIAELIAARVDLRARRKVHVNGADLPGSDDAGATVRAPCGRHLDELRLVAHAGQDERDRLGGQPLHERPPDPAVGAGDEHGGAGQVHQYSSRYS